MTPADTGPRRLFPAAALLRVGRIGPSAVAAGVGALALDNPRLSSVAIGLSVAALVALVAAVLDWWRFTYRIDEDALVIEQGVLRRSHRSIPRDRIQDVSIEQDLIRRFLGMVKVKVETAGGEANEASLDSVSRAEAVRLRAMLARSAVAPGSLAASGEVEAMEPPVPPTLVFKMSPRRLALHAMFGFSLVWIAVIFGLLQFVDDALGLRWEALFDLGRNAATEVGAAVVAAGVVLAVLLGFLTGAARNVARDYNFHLFHARERFRRVRGLFTRTEVVIAEARIQLALIRRAPVSGRFGWRSVEVQTLGGSDDPGGRQQMAPFASAAEAAEVLEACRLPPFQPAKLVRVAPAHALRSALRTSLPLALGIIAAGLVTPAFWLGVLLLPGSIALAVLQRTHHRYAACDTSLQIARGVLTRRAWIVPYRAVQAVTIEASWLQRRLGAATVTVSTAGARGWVRPVIADLPARDAAALAAFLVAHAG